MVAVHMMVSPGGEGKPRISAGTQKVRPPSSPSLAQCNHGPPLEEARAVENLLLTPASAHENPLNNLRVLEHA